MKITFMGAGSTVFARNVIGDCMCCESLRDSVFALYDICLLYTSKHCFSSFFYADWLKQHPVPSSLRQPSGSRRCSRRLPDCLRGRILSPYPGRCGKYSP